MICLLWQVQQLSLTRRYTKEWSSQYIKAPIQKESRFLKSAQQRPVCRLISTLSFWNWKQINVRRARTTLLATDSLTAKRQCQIFSRKIKWKVAKTSIIPKGFFLSLHFSLNSRIIFFISSSTAALEGAHTRTRFCLILALKFSSEWPFLWLYNLSHSRQWAVTMVKGKHLFLPQYDNNSGKQCSRYSTYEHIQDTNLHSYIKHIYIHKAFSAIKFIPTVGML